MPGVRPVPAWRYAFVITALFLGGAVASLTVLWTTGGTEEAEPGPAVFGLCNVSLASVPEGVTVAAFPDFRHYALGPETANLYALSLQAPVHPGRS